MRTSFFLFLFAVAVMAGCKSSSTSPNGSTTLVMPNAGSYYVTVDIETDSTGTLVSSDTTTTTVAQTGLPIYGKTNVLELVEDTSGVPEDTVYIHYESNGDVSYHSTPNPELFGELAGWEIFPFASQQQQTLTADTTEDGETANFTETFLGAGSGTITINGQQFSEQNITGSLKIIETGILYNDTSTSTGTESFAPSLGYLVESRNPGTRDPSTGMMGNSDHSYVIRYLLK